MFLVVNLDVKVRIPCEVAFTSLSFPFEIYMESRGDFVELY